MSKMSREELEQKLDSIKENIGDMMTTLVKVKGENYAKLVTHTMNTFMIAKLGDAPDEIRNAILSKVMGGIIGDLGESWGINLEDDAVRDEFDKNVQAILDLTNI